MTTYTLPAADSSVACRSPEVMRTLIVEDDPNTADYLQKGLGEHGFVSDVADNGVDGLHLALTGDYDFSDLKLDVVNADNELTATATMQGYDGTLNVCTSVG